MNRTENHDERISRVSSLEPVSRLFPGVLGLSAGLLLASVLIPIVMPILVELGGESPSHSFNLTIGNLRVGAMWASPIVLLAYGTCWLAMALHSLFRRP